MSRHLFSTGALLLLLTSLLAAQPAMPEAAMSAALSKLFGEHQAFTAKADVQVFEASSPQPSFSTTMGFAMLDGKIRTELNMADLKSAKMPPGAADGMKQMGMDRIVSIVRPDQKNLFIIYPGLKAYVPMPLPKEADDQASKYKVETTPVGKETIGKHSTVKNKVVLTTETGEKQEAFTWNATDLKNFPIRIEMTDKGTRSLIVYRDVQLSKPAADLFEPPKDYTRHENIQQMMQAAMQKMMGGKK